MYVHIYVCTHICMSIRIRVLKICSYVPMYVCTCIPNFVCTYSSYDQISEFYQLFNYVCTYVYKLLHVVANSSEVIACYYMYLMNYMDADSVSHMMHCNHLISDDDYKAITAAPNDSKMNISILEYVKAMDLTALLKFADLLVNINTQQSIGNNLKLGMYTIIVYKFYNLQLHVLLCAVHACTGTLRPML